MSATIDPVTGLPIVVPLTTGLDTISLGVQTFPWNDYKATQRPNRQLYYPDDIIPVSANVAGMYQDQSQAVGTDGKHALLVSDVNSGGGGGFGPIDMHTSFVQGMNEGFSELSSPVSVLYKLAIVGTYPDSTEYSVLSGIPFYLSATDDVGGIVLIARDPGMTYHNTIAGTQMITYQMDFVGGWNLLPLLGGSPALWFYLASSDALFHNLMLWGT